MSREPPPPLWPNHFFLPAERALTPPSLRATDGAAGRVVISSGCWQRGFIRTKPTESRSRWASSSATERWDACRSQLPAQRSDHNDPPFFCPTSQPTANKGLIIVWNDLVIRYYHEVDSKPQYAAGIVGILEFAKPAKGARALFLARARRHAPARPPTRPPACTGAERHPSCAVG